MLLVEEDGEWRIADAPDGIVLSRFHFAELFRAHSLHWLTPDGTRAVPEVRWFERTATTAASRIIDALHCLEETAGVRIEVEHTPQEGLPPSIIADITAAGRDLGWAPNRSDIETIIADAWPCWPRTQES